MSQSRGIWEGRGKQVLVLACLLFLPLQCMGFLPGFWSRVLTLSWGSHTHQDITERAILNVTLEVLRGTTKHKEDPAEQEARLDRGFWRAVKEVVNSNANMDSVSSFSSDPVYHFDSERVDGSIMMLRQIWTQIVLSARAKEYQKARHSLGQLFHSLQDFYSHSNWVEMGKRSVYLHLLQPDEPAIPVAKDDTPTCTECLTVTCRNNLLPAVANTQENSKLLTTGYFSTSPLKPKGKCSHGGVMDLSTLLSARGGINKDSTSPLFSPHHYLHGEAVTLATEATLTVLRDLKDTVGPTAFLKMFRVKQTPALVFVIDTTGSMFEEITAARMRAHSIILSRAKSARQPGTFVLVPFHDPGVGPVFEDDDPNIFTQHLENLMALGGGDEPEMCLSAIQLALTHSPPLSEIFVFTDASPKDAHLFDTVKALALEKQSKITFLLTEDPVYTTGMRRKSKKRRSTEPLSPDRFSLYSSLSSLSGGLTIFTSNTDISNVSAIVEDNTAIDKVTLLHGENDKDLMSVHSFRVDSSVKNVILHITGTMTECILTSPLGQDQPLLRANGPLAELEHFQGLYRVRLLSPVEPGQWELRAKTDGQFTFNVIADSSVDFLYYFATINNKTHPGLAKVEGSPVAGFPAFLVLAVTGLPSDNKVSLSYATLLGAKGGSLQQVKLNFSYSTSYTSEEFVGLVDPVPRAPFSVRITGQDSRGNKMERVSTEIVQPTHVQIQVLSVPLLAPGHSTKVDFEILNYGPARLFNLTADDDCRYLQMRGSPGFPVGEQGSFRGQVNLLTPATAPAGTTVTLTLTVRALNSPDSNYAVVYLTVVPPDPDTSPPSCSAARVVSDCPGICNKSSWSVSVVVSDNGRSGLAALQLQQGEGVLTLYHSPPLPKDSFGEQQHVHKNKTGGEGHHHHHQHQHQHQQARLKRGEPAFNVSQWALGSSQPLWARYTSSCCSAQAEMLVWDTAGNMKRCRLTSGQQRKQREISRGTSGAGRSTTTGFLLTLGLLGSLQT